MNLANKIGHIKLPDLNRMLGTRKGVRFNSLPYKDGVISIQAGFGFYSKPGQFVEIAGYSCFEIAVSCKEIPDILQGYPCEPIDTDFYMFPYVPRELIELLLAEEKWRHRI